MKTFMKEEVLKMRRMIVISIIMAEMRMMNNLLTCYIIAK